MAYNVITNFAGQTNKSNISKLGLGYSLNMYAEITDTQWTSNIINRSIAGSVKIFDNLNGTCRGLYRVSRSFLNKPLLYGVFGNKLYMFVSDFEYYEIFTLETYSGRVTFTETGGYTNPHIVFADGDNVYAINVNLGIGDQQKYVKRTPLPLRLGTSVEKKNAEYIKPTHVAYLYGYLVCNDRDTDQIYISYHYPWESKDDSEIITEESKYYNDIWQISQHDEEWKTYGHTVAADWNPDNTIALISNGSKLYTFGDRSYQVFQYANDYNVPFSSPNNAAGNIGLKSTDSLAMLGNNVCFLGSSDIGENGIFLITDGTIRRISTEEIENDIANYNNPRTAKGQIFREHSHTFYALTFEDNNITWVYDIEQGLWHNRSSLNEDAQQKAWNNLYGLFAYDAIYFGTNDGCLIKLDEHIYREYNGKPILKLRRGNTVLNNHRQFYIDSLDLVINNGQTEMFDNPRLNIRYSWDGNTFSDMEEYYFGEVGKYDYRTTVWHCGMGTYFTLEISTTEEIPLVIETLKINYTETSLFI